MYSYFTYCVHVLGKAYASTMKPLIILKTADRVTTQSHRYAHHHGMFTYLNVKI